MTRHFKFIMLSVALAGCLASTGHDDVAKDGMLFSRTLEPISIELFGGVAPSFYTSSGTYSEDRYHAYTFSVDRGAALAVHAHQEWKEIPSQSFLNAQAWAGRPEAHHRYGGTIRLFTRTSADEDQLQEEQWTLIAEESAQLKRPEAASSIFSAPGSWEKVFDLKHTIRATESTTYLLLIDANNAAYREQAEYSFVLTTGPAGAADASAPTPEIRVDFVSIYDAETTVPAAGTVASIGTQKVVADEDGRAVFHDVPPGIHVLKLGNFGEYRPIWGNPLQRVVSIGEDQASGAIDLNSYVMHVPTGAWECTTQSADHAWSIDSATDEPTCRTLNSPTESQP